MIPQFVNGSYGQVLKINTGIDLTGYTSLEMEFEKPDGSIVTKAAALDGQATAGVIKYSVDQNLFTASGLWKVVAKVTFSGGLFWSHPPGRFAVVDEFVD